MTINELRNITTEAHSKLGFFIDDPDSALYDLMRHTTSRRATQAIETVAADSTCKTMLEKYNALVKILQKSPKRQKVTA